MSVTPSSVKTDIPLKGFKVTISTKFDVSDLTISKFTKWAKKADMHHIVAEHGASGTKHIHALLCFKEPKVKRMLADYIWRHHVKLHNEGANIQKYAVRVDVLYDNKWHDEYLSKESTHEVISSEYDADNESEYYPIPGVKEELEGLTVRNARSNFWDDVISKLKTWWSNRHPERDIDTFDWGSFNVEQVHKFYMESMFAGRLPHVSDDRRRRQNVNYLWMILTNHTDPSYEDRKYYASFHGSVCEFRG